jgi:hypothetical protein
MLRGLILLIPETTNPGNYSPVPAHNQLIQQGQVHTVNETPVKTIEQVLEVLLVLLVDLQVVRDVLEVEELELLEDFLCDCYVRVGLEKTVA